MGSAILWGAIGWGCLVVACGLVIWIGTRRMPAPGFVDPAFRAPDAAPDLGLAEDEHWAGVESSWLRFVESLPVMDKEQSA